MFRKVIVLGFSWSEAGRGAPTCSRKSLRLRRRKDRAISCCPSGTVGVTIERSKEPLDLMRDMVRRVESCKKIDYDLLGGMKENDDDPTVVLLRSETRLDLCGFLSRERKDPLFSMLNGTVAVDFYDELVPIPICPIALRRIV